jgi:hypothetical protein
VTGRVDYPWLRAWHYTTGSLPSSGYVEALVRQARRERAPQDALYDRAHAGGGAGAGWALLRDLPDDHPARATMAAWLESHGYELEELER